MFRLDINKRLIRYKTRFRHYELTRLTRFYSNHLLLSEPLNLSSMFHHENEFFSFVYFRRISPYGNVVLCFVISGPLIKGLKDSRKFVVQ